MVDDFEYGEFTNLVPTATTTVGGTEIYNGIGYKNGAYVSSDGTFGVDTNTVAVGYLSFVPGDVIYIKGAELNANSHVRLYTDTKSGTAYRYSDTLTNGATEWKDTTGKVFFYIEYLGDKYYKLTPNTELFTESKYYYRASLYGAGDNLIITHNEAIHKTDGVQTYSVTNNLTNAVNSNTATNVVGGSSYSATITANNGYVLESIAVTMGGVDITTSTISGVNINIPDVTGDIVITATAIIAPTYSITNLVPTSTTKPGGTEIYNGAGYKNGAYISDNGTFGTDSNTVAVGYLPLLLDGAIYIKGAELNTNSHVRIYVDKNNGSGFRYSSALTTNEATEWKDTTGTTFFYIEYLGDKYYKLTPNIDVFYSSESYCYRVSLYGTGDNLIITHNEPIE
jgi:hypothetical protein